LANQNSKFRWPSFVIGGSFLIIGIVIFSYPVENLYAITWLIGLFSLISGILEIVFRRANKKVMGVHSGWIFVVCVINLFFGFVIFSYAVENFYVITWLVGLFSLISGILEIVFRRANKKVMGVPSGWTFVLGIINIVFGLVVMFNSAESSVFLIYIFAVWFMIYYVIAIFTITPAV